MASAPKAWLSYAWADNTGAQADDVDFLIQQIRKEGVDVQFDRRVLIPGQRLWDAIGRHIEDEALTDAWILVVTAASISSEPCKEELGYALDRALSKRGAGFPMIGLVTGDVPAEMPPALRIRLWVSTNDPDWAAKVASGVRKEAPASAKQDIQPFLADVAAWGGQSVLVVRPRVGSWAPFIFGLPLEFADRAGYYTFAPEQAHNAGGMLSSLGEWDDGGIHWTGVSQPTVTRSTCAHIFLRMRPGDRFPVHFGQKGGPIFSHVVAA